MSTEEEIADNEAPESVSEPQSAGDALRAAREERRMTLDHVGAETRIPMRHLQAIESGDFESLPSRTYAIGFAKTYARTVGLDETTIADQVREELGEAGLRHSGVGQGMEPGDPAKLPSRGLAWFGGFAALILVIGVIAFASTYFGAGTGPASLIAQEEEAAAQELAAAQTTEDAAQTAAPVPEGQVVFTATTGEVWVRFYEEGGDRLFEGVMTEGDTFEVPEDAQDPWINTGRPNQFAITIGGQAVDPLSEETINMQVPVSADALLARTSE
ncbi:MAG: helix-turn-helix domain-containing protein [Pseudomonadota bacterium]|nr:helix-turn-helix domain-containing protein [Pseudomonadota bacterium]